MARLEMHQLAELPAREHFEIEHVIVKGGIINMGRTPRSRFFVWKDPRQNHDIVVFIGEAQPPTGKYLFCRKLIDFAKVLGVERVLTFAAMATEMAPGSESRVFGAATNRDTLEELRRLELEILDDGHIGGLNGLVLGLAAEEGLPGACLLGEMPHLFTQLPYPRASLAVLEAFTAMARIDLDLIGLETQAEAMDQQLSGLMEQIEEAIEKHRSGGEGDTLQLPPFPIDEGVGGESVEKDDADRQRIERLFEEAAADLSRAYELKAELDRLKLFAEFEDRFLDLFKNP